MKTVVERVAIIGRALKRVSHPNTHEQERADVDALIEGILIVCANEFKYVASVELSLCAKEYVFCHIDEIQQALLNLIVNASERMKDTSEKGVIRIATREKGDSLVLTVTDNGNGIHESTRARIFEPFGGQLTFESVVGKGTTFTVRLPRSGTTRRITNPSRG